jgi:hypothetical protein
MDTFHTSGTQAPRVRLRPTVVTPAGGYGASDPGVAASLARLANGLPALTAPSSGRLGHADTQTESTDEVPGAGKSDAGERCGCAQTPSFGRGREVARNSAQQGLA